MDPYSSPTRTTKKKTNKRKKRKRTKEFRSRSRTRTRSRSRSRTSSSSSSRTSSSSSSRSPIKKINEFSMNEGDTNVPFNNEIEYMDYLIETGEAKPNDIFTYIGNNQDNRRVYRLFENKQTGELEWKVSKSRSNYSD